MKTLLAILLLLAVTCRAEHEQYQVSRVISLRTNLSWSFCNPQSTHDIIVDVKGARPGDMVNVTAPQAMQYAGAIYSAWVYQPGVVTVRLTNITSQVWGPIGPGKFRITVLKFR